MVNIIYSLISFVLFSIRFSGYNGKCTNGMPYKKSNECVNNCIIEDLIVDQTCIPVSTSKTHIEAMITSIKSYIADNSASITNNIIIEGEEITYQIMKSNLLGNNANNIINLSLGNKCLNKIKAINTDFYVILINVINSNYATSKNGLIIICSNQELSLNICEGETISFGIPISVPQKTLTTYTNIHDKYNIDIFNLNSSFYTDICETYTTEDKTDMSLSLRKEIYGSHGIDVCAQNCEYKKYDIGANKIYCECLIKNGNEDNKNTKNVGQKIYDGITDFLDLLNLDVMLCTKIAYSSGVKGLIKNYGFMIMTIISFLYIITIIISLCIFSKLINKKVDSFKDLENKYKTLLEKDNNNNIKNENEPQNSTEKILKLNNIQSDPKDNKEEKKQEEEEEEDEEEEEEEDDDIEEEKKEGNNNNEEPKKENYLNNKDQKNDIKIEEPKRYDEHEDIKRTTPLKNNEDDANIVEHNNSPSYPPSYSYYDYLNYYNNYMKYMNQQQQYYQNMNNQQQITPQNNFNQLKDDDVIKIQIPYEQILENIKKAKQQMKKKKAKSKDNKHKKRKHNKNPENNDEKENEFENPKRVIRKSKKSKNKKKKDKKPIKFELKLVDLLKPHPPKKVKILNNNNDITSSQNRGLNLNNNIDNTKRDENSVYNLYNRSNKKYLSNKSYKSNNSAITNKNNATILTNKPDDENLADDKYNIEVKEKENEKEIVNEENNNNNKQYDFIFGSSEFSENILKIKEEERMQFFIDEELNGLEYKYAIEIDKRSFFKIYMSILRKQNVLIFCVLYCIEDYNFSIIKFTFLMFQFIIYITVSALFFTDNTLNNIYKNKNKFDFPFMIRQLAFTFLICLGINIIFKLLVKTDGNIIDIKYGKKQFNEAKCKIKCKFIFYFIFGIIFIIFGWFYISSFCAVYSNTQIILIKCAGYSLAISFIYPFFTSLLSASFRKCALNNQYKDKECLYDFSKMLEYFI